jgi:signal transduction histidine kinase
MSKYLQPFLFILFGLFVSQQAVAEEVDTVLQQLNSRFMNLYNTSSSKEEFYEAGEQLSIYFRKHDNLLAYYKTQVNICLYDTEHNRPFEAMKRANKILEEMRDDEFDAYCQVYMALGTIFESRGNYLMARHYYEQAIDNLATEDVGSRMGVYSRMAYLLMFRDPVEAEYWNKKYYDESLTFPPYHQVYLFIDGMINFTVGNKRGFANSYQAYLTFHDQNDGLDNYGLETLQIADLAFKGEYDEALQRAAHMTSSDISTIGTYDLRIIIYKMMNQYPMAFEMSQQKALCTDSLNSDMLFTNMNELNAQIGLAQAQNKASRYREVLFFVILTLSVILITLLSLLIIRYRKSKKEMKAKNDQLHAALSMAEEGEKMKAEFVRSVSHEIRTPLNAISGFNDILNTPGMTLSDDERADFLQRIKDNIQAITNIVDEMLRVADKESNEFYPKGNKIYCNQFLSSLIYQYRDLVNSAVQLKYTTRVINRYQIDTNMEGLKKIVEQLLQNAIKFTKSGFIELHCELVDEDRKIAISVTDTGKGVAPDKQDKIFDDFYKEDAFQQGIGLGLSVSKKIAKKLGGELTLDKDYTEGARFVLTLSLFS